MSAGSRIEELRRKLQENPRRYFAPLANELRLTGAAAEAVALCRAHLPRHPEHLSGFIVFGQALFDLGELTEARAVFEQALGVDPENLVALRSMGDIAKRRGDPAAARRWYERVLEADPRNDAVASQLDTLVPGPPEAVPFRPPQEPITRPVANASARRTEPAPAVEEDDPFAFPPAAPGTEPDVVFEEGLMAPVVWPDTADLVARRLTPRALPVFAMPADEDTIAAFGRESRDPQVAAAPRPVAPDPVAPELVVPELVVPELVVPEPVVPEPVARGSVVELPVVEASVQEPSAMTPSTVAPPPAAPPVAEALDRAPAAPALERPKPFAGGPRAVDEGDLAIDAIFGGALALRAEAAHGAPVPPPEGHPVSPAPLPPIVVDDDEPTPAPPPSAFFTETMAELLLAQGYVGRAIDVYEALVAQRPGDEPLRARLRAAKAQGAPSARPRDEAAAPVEPPPPRVAPPAPTLPPAPAVASGTSVTARERLARLARTLTSADAAPVDSAGGLNGWVSGLPPREPLFSGPGRAADERVARLWADAFRGATPPGGREPDPFDRLWEQDVAGEDDLSLEHYFAVRTPPRPAVAVPAAAGAGTGAHRDTGGTAP